MSQGQRRLAAVMFTDMVGYTALGQRNESLALALVEEQKKLIRPILARYNGREVKTMGDGFLIEFASALEGTKCAYDIQRAVRESNASAPENPKIRLRIGLHLGDVVEAGGDISGDAVNIASRIEALAEEGGVCLTRQVYDQVQNKVDFRFSGIGSRHLKNVNAPVEVFRIAMPWEPAFKVVAPSQFDRYRVAVLPFSNLSPDQNDVYFADGLTEELISAISRIGGLKVIARTSAMSYRGSGKKIGDIAGELNAGTILEGSVRKAGEKLRITVQLVDSMSGDSIWSEVYDRDFEDIFAIQSDIAKNVAGTLRVRLLPEPQRVNTSTGSAEAYSHYLKGRYFWNQRELDGLNKALKEFELAIEKDPDFALAYAGRADTYLLLGRNGHIAPKHAYPMAIEDAEKAISLDARLAEPHVAVAAIMQEYEWRWTDADREFRDAIALNPNSPIGRSWYALYLGHIGRFDEAIEQARLGQELDPLSPRAHCAASEQYLFARQYDKAIEAADKALEISPEFGGAFGYRAYALLEKRMYEEAIADFQEAAKFFGARAVMGRLGHAYAVSGGRSEAMKILDQLADESRKEIPPKIPFIAPPPDTSLDMGLVHLGLGENEKAIGWFEKAVEVRTAEVIHFKCEPIYDSIQGEPGFRALVRKIGLDD